MMIEALIAVTLLSAVVVLAAPERWAAKLAFALSLLPLAGSLWMYSTFDATGNALLNGSLAFETQAAWITLGQYDIGWHVGMDGISMALVALTTVLMPLALLSAWTPIDERKSQFYGMMLFMEASLIGVFTALDFFAWFVFWELSWCRCTSSSASGAGRAGSTPPSSSSCTPTWPAW